MRKLFSKFVMGGIILLMLLPLLGCENSGASIPGPAPDPEAGPITAYFGGHIPELTWIEEYSHEDIEGAPCHLLLLHTAERQYYAFDLLTGAVTAADESDIGEYMGSLDSADDIRMYFLWISDSAHYSSFNGCYMNSEESRRTLTMEELLEWEHTMQAPPSSAAVEETIASAGGEEAVSTSALEEPAFSTPDTSEPPVAVNAILQSAVQFTLIDDLPDSFTARTLSERELASLKDTDIDTLRAKIATPADLAAWVDSLGTAYYSNIVSSDRLTRTFDPVSSLSWSQSMIGGPMIADLARYVLEDDYPGIGTVLAFIDCDDINMVSGSLIPFENNYYLVSVERMTELFRNAIDTHTILPECFAPMKLPDVSAIIGYCGSSSDIAFPDGVLTQAFLITGTEPVVFERESDVYTPDSPSANEFYRNESALTAREARLFGHIRPENIRNYQISRVLGGTTLSPEEVYALVDEEPEVVRSRVKTAADVLMYMLAANIQDCHGDRTKEVGGRLWHYNLNAGEVMEQHAANCGATANLARYLLDGDYDEVGFILHAYTPGNGGGHVYNYIRDGGNTYIVDFSWYIFANYRAENDFPVMKLTSLEEYGNRVNELYQDVCLVLAHTSEGQHYPNVFSDETEPGTAVYGLPAGVKYTVLYRSGRSGDYQVGEYPLGQHSLNWTRFW